MEEFNLNLDSILSEDQIAALQEEQTPPSKETTGGGEVTQQVDTEDYTIENMFGPESVGETKEEKGKETKDTEEKEDVVPPMGGGESPDKKNLYSSFAEALKVDDIFPDLSDEDIEGIKSADDFRELVKAQLKNSLTERQKRLEVFMEAGVEPGTIKAYEESITALRSIKPEQIEGDKEENVSIRRSLIRAGYKNKGYSDDRADELTQRSFDNNTDIADAKVALQENLDYYTGEYQKLYEEAEKAVKDEEETTKAQVNALKKSILEDKDAFGNVEVDKKVRQKVYDAISRPVYKDGDTYYTEIQKYEKEHHNDFMKYLGYFFVLTDGFKSLEKVEKQVEKKAKKKGIEDLERTLQSTFRGTSGDMRFVSGVNDTPQELGMFIDVS